MITRVVHCKKSDYDIYIGRPSKWGNPFTHKAGTIAHFIVPTVEEAVSQYEEWLRQQSELLDALLELKGKVLGCWCKPKLCHGDILCKWANWIEPCANCKLRGAWLMTSNGPMCSICSRNHYRS
jgi:hypothetical protein